MAATVCVTVRGESCARSMVPADPHVLRRDRHRHAPIFVLAPPRSGSSVIATMLGQHPDLWGFPELRLFIADHLVEVTGPPRYLASTSGREVNAGLLRAIAMCMFGDQGVASIAKATEWLGSRYWRSPIYVMDCLLEVVRPRRAVEKSPETASTPGALNRLLIHYPRATIVHLVRHPVAAVASARELWQPLTGFGREVVDDAVDAWLWSHERLLRVSALVPEKRVITIRAEEVLADPARHMTDLARRLGLDAGTRALESMLHPERSPFAKPGPHTAPYGNDPKFLQRPTVRRLRPGASIQKLGEWGVDELRISLIRDLAGRLGYEQ